MLLRIENLAQAATEEAIRSLFAAFGDVRAVSLTTGPLPEKRLGSGLVEMDGGDAGRIVGMLDHRLFEGALLRVTEVCPAHEKASPAVAPKSSGAPDPVTSRPHNRLRNTLQLVSVEKLADSIAGQSNDWCRYTISSGAGSITGLRRGNIGDVKQYAEEAAEAFNQRNMLKSGRPTTWSTNPKK